MSPGSKLATWLGHRIGTPTTNDHIDRIMRTGDVKVALDIGCGITSHLSRFRPKLQTVGLDAYTVAEAEKSGAHDHYISLDVTSMSVEAVQNELERLTGKPKADLVTLFGVIEHLPKAQGFELLDKVEHLSSKYIFVDTPNGFVPQGPEFGNPYQRHLSGWFPHDFQGYGYSVHGCVGTRYLRGYMGEPRIPIPGLRLFDQVVMSRVLMTQRFPGHAFCICAVKDINGVPARYDSYDDPRRI